MTARDRLNAYIDRHVDYDEPEFPAALDTFQREHRTEVLGEAMSLVDSALTAEPDHGRASPLYEVLLRLSGLHSCTCARSQGLHEKECHRYVPGHKLVSPARALAAFRVERGDAR